MMVRFWSGIAGGALAGLAVFRWSLFQPGHPAFECLTVGALTAGLFALARQSQRGEALALALAFGGVRFLLTPVVRFNALLAGLALGFGLFVVALIFDLLARRGWRFGKFLLVGPLVGGVFLALAPITEQSAMNVHNAAQLLLFRVALGVLIGEGVALGVELADWPLARLQRPTTT